MNKTMKLVSKERAFRDDGTAYTKHNKLLATFMTCKEYEAFKDFLKAMELHEFIDGHGVTEGGEDLVEVIIYKEVK